MKGSEDRLRKAKAPREQGESAVDPGRTTGRERGGSVGRQPPAQQPQGTMEKGGGNPPSASTELEEPPGCCESKFWGMPCFVSVIVVVYYYLTMNLMIPMLAPEHTAAWSLGMMAMSHVGTFFTLGAYHMAVYADPGPVPQSCRDHELTGGETKSDYCWKCQALKPPRTHHCKYCARCVVRYDHHCDWIDNCVGQGNHKNFFLFQFYISACIIHYLYILSNLVVGVEDREFGTSFWWGAHLILTILYSIVVVPLSFFGVGFCGWTTHLMLQNQTTLENQNGEEYDRGAIFNLKTVLGPDWRLWFWPFHGFPPPPVHPARREANPAAELV